jgi:hypothetical protein
LEKKGRGEKGDKPFLLLFCLQVENVLFVIKKGPVAFFSPINYSSFASLTPILFVLSFIEDEMGFFQALKKEGQSIIKRFDLFSEFIF